MQIYSIVPPDEIQIAIQNKIHNICNRFIQNKISEGNVKYYYE